jgi:hypothetical protein
MKPIKLQNGLTQKTVNCLTKAGIPIKKKAILNALKSGTLFPHRNPRNYGKYTHREICRWLGIAYDPTAMSTPQIHAATHEISSSANLNTNF